MSDTSDAGDVSQAANVGEALDMILDRGSQSAPAAPVETGAGDAGGTSPAPAAPAPPTAETAPLADDVIADGQTFDAQYVRDLRAENARYRTERNEAREQLGRYQEFTDYDDGDLAVWKDLATKWKDDPRQAANVMRTIAENVLGDPNATPQQQAEAAEVIQQTNAAQTPEDVEKIIQSEFARRDEQAQLDAEVRQIEDTITAAGIAKGTADYANVLWHATNNPEAAGDINKAIEAHKAGRQAVIDEYVNSVANGATPQRVNSAAGVPGAEAPPAPTNLKEAKERSNAWLDERMG